MPLYDLECNDCGHKWEVKKPVDEPVPECPECKSKAVIIIISNISFQLKGMGWAKDGYSK